MNVKCQEDLLQAWVRMFLCIRGNRILSDLSVNEMIIYGILLRRQREGGEPLTATELGEETRLLKSQMNRILSDMEKRSLIERVRGTEDRRKVYLHLREDHACAYLREHGRVMELLRCVAEELGEEKVKTLTALVGEATRAADRFQRREAEGPAGKRHESEKRNEIPPRAAADGTGKENTIPPRAAANGTGKEKGESNP